MAFVGPVVFRWVSIVLCLFLASGFLGAQQITKPPDTLNFLVVGDWGGLPDFPYRTPIEEAVAISMGKYADAHNVEFVLALGDNFYFDGVKDVNDPRFRETYESVFTASSLDIDWHFIAGNHDHNGNVSAQMLYDRIEKRWNFPYFFYSLTFGVPFSEKKVDIVMIDTVILCGNSDHDFLHKQPTGPFNKFSAVSQLKWIEEFLQNSDADYLIVAGHYPVLSVAEHGPTQCLVEKLMPLLYKYKVTAYFSGHDHNLQHLAYAEKSNHTVNYFVSGAANFIDPSKNHWDDVPEDALHFHWANILSLGGFGHVSVSDTNMTFTFTEANGKTLYTTEILPRKV